MTKIEAYIDAITSADHFMGGAVVVKYEDDTYEAIPGAYLTDISYQGSREIVLDLRQGMFNSTGYDHNDGTAEEIARMLIMAE